MKTRADTQGPRTRRRRLAHGRRTLLPLVRRRIDQLEFWDGLIRVVRPLAVLWVLMALVVLWWLV